MSENERLNPRNRLTPAVTSEYACLRDPVGYKGAAENRHWNITVKFSKEDGERFIEEVKEIAEDLMKKEVETRTRLRKQINKTIPPIFSYKENQDGTYSFNFKRKESLGSPPAVLDMNRSPIDPFVRHGAKVQLAYNLFPYVMPATHMFGVSFQLIAVRMLEPVLPNKEIEGTFTTKDKNTVNLDDLF